MIRTETITRQADLFAKNIFVDVILNYIETTLKKARKIKKKLQNNRSCRKVTLEKKLELQRVESAFYKVERDKFHLLIHLSTTK